MDVEILEAGRTDDPLTEEPQESRGNMEDQQPEQKPRGGYLRGHQQYGPDPQTGNHHGYVHRIKILQRKSPFSVQPISCKG